MGVLAVNKWKTYNDMKKTEKVDGADITGYDKKDADKKCRDGTPEDQTANSATLKKCTAKCSGMPAWNTAADDAPDKTYCISFHFKSDTSNCFTYWKVYPTNQGTGESKSICYWRKASPLL